MLTLSVVSHWSDGNRNHVVADLTASGNYATGGDTVDFSSDFKVKSSRVPDFVVASGVGGYNYEFDYGTTIANGKMVVYVLSTGAELAAGAYPAGVVNNPIRVHAIFKKV